MLRTTPPARFPAHLLFTLGMLAWPGGGSTLFGQATAADSLPPPVFFLSLDGYFRYADTEATSLTSPTLAHDELGIGWLSAGATHALRRAGVSGKVAFGPRAQQFYDEGDGGIFSYVREAFGFFDFSDRVRLSAGLFPAFYGFEADDPFDNFLYSNSWAYTLAPACPSGVQLEVDLGRGWGLLLGRYNEVFSRFNPNRRAIYGGSLLYERPETFTVALSTLFGQTTTDQRILALDLTADLALTDRWYLGTEVVHQPFRDPGEAWTAYSSVGAYLRYELPSSLLWSFRGEWLADRGGFGFPVGTELLAATLSVSRVWGAMRVFGEVRTERANQDVYAAGTERAETAALLGFAYLLTTE